MRSDFWDAGLAECRPGRNQARLLTVALLAVGALLLGMAGKASADQVVRLTLDASTAECDAYAQADCSYLEARNGNAPAPDPETGPNPTFLNLADLPAPVTVDATIADDGTVTVNEGDFNFPNYPTTLSNALVGDVAVQISVQQTGTWSGTFDDATGAMDLEAPLGLRFTLNCDAVANALCAGVFGPQGNMGTWVVDTTEPVDPLTTGELIAPTPPLEYGPEWLGPDVETGSPFDPETTSLTLINNNLVLEYIDASSCVDMTSAACANPAVAGLVAPALNGAIGTVWDSAAPENSLNSVAGAVDMRLEFTMAEPPTVEVNPTELDFPGLNADGTQPLGTSSPAQTITVSAFELGDLKVGSFFTEGGDEDDFQVTSANQCRNWIPAGSDCDVKLKFNPSATGARSSTLYVSVLNPVSEQWETHELTALSGEGGVLPSGATGPEGPQGPKGDNGAQGKAGGLVAIKSASRVKLKTGKSKVATIKANGNSVKLGVPKKVKVKIKGKVFKLKIKAPGKVAAGKKGNISVKGTKGAVKRLKGRKTTLKVKVKVTAGDQTRSETIKTTLFR